ncbi:putative bifunctional diguanylate cyclase/phosphodiesterase [Arthrobacter zhaoguopingii]|uniref:putative bifunctional diguanylate cyclase/phosphodiesterase n=1 Tax=Arthrobacter zhaoguopingii TaxID=2681491 RepID=UPI0013589BE2|nr:EAL domain-containing protein [Arthrobacter zhaoguopingii]
MKLVPGESATEEKSSIDVLTAARSAAADIALITDAGQAITHVSTSFTAMTGYEPADLLGRNCRVMQGPGTDPETKRQMRDLLASKEVFEGQVLNYRKDGSAFWTALRIVPVRAGTGTEVTHFVSVQRDISNKVALLKQLQDQALHDPVTGLPNRTAAEQAIDEAVRMSYGQEATAAIGLIDLDDFRLINNTYGHAAGDAVLRQWSTRVLSRLREGDMLARMGGDEFILILKNIVRNTVDEDLPEVLNRLHGAVEEPFQVAGQQVHIGMSMGIALVPQDGTDSRSILLSADEALYRVKGREDGNLTWWEAAEHLLPPLGAGPRASTGYADRVGPVDYRSALASGSVLVYLQPVVDLRDGSVDYFEALARLRLAGGHIASPEEFLPHLDADDQRELFTVVLDRALEVIAAWDQEGRYLGVSVNLPPEILHDRTIPQLIGDALSAHALLPGRLGLELLESPDIDLETQRVALQELSALGVGLAMDDLGSGHSSLQRLSSFPFSTIKLDRGLFLHVSDKPLETLSIMATLMQMGRDLGLSVVIEGLEDDSLTEAAIILGAPLGQGYYFAKPLAPQDCLRWIDSFTFELHLSPIQTSLGALAYHWQFARLAAPHPLELQRCPLTRFIDDTGAAAEVKAWHALQHSQTGMHPASSRLLIDWLTHRIRTPQP